MSRTYEEGVRRQLEGFGAVRLQCEGAPDAADRGVAQTGTLGHGPGAPCVASLGVDSSVSVITRSTSSSVTARGRPLRGLVRQAVQSPFQEPGTPLRTPLDGSSIADHPAEASFRPRF